MKINRECYVINYRYRSVYRRVNKIKGLDIYYSSRRQRYIVAYFDTENKEQILEQLNKIRGITNIEPSRLDLKEMNLKL